ncbi:hypothetical protein PJL15_00101 [Paenarthrobacter nitroguajacolicus]|nr:hypothetical protein [Paenarthrobacter nitroguajacolicus]
MFSNLPQRRGTRVDLYSVILVGCLALLLASCSSTETDAVAPDPSAKVQLDYEKSLISFPLDAYRISPQERARILLAREVIMTNCMKQFGFIDDPNLAYPQFENRNYGVWNVERVKRLGFHLVNENSGTSGAEQESGPWGDARYACLDQEKSKLDQITPSDELFNGGVAFRLAQRSLTLASQTDTWKQGSEDWRACITAAGLTPMPGFATWSSQQGFDLQHGRAPGNQVDSGMAEEISIATVEAQCNQEVHLTQRLGDIQASFQVPLIKANQAALTEVRQQSIKYVDAAEKLLTENR